MPRSAACAGRNAVVDEIHRLQQSIATMGPKEAPHELAALLDVHLMLLQDEELISGVKRWITERLYNAEWALTTQLEVIARQFDEMEDEYLRERKADLEQVVERILRHMKGVASPVAPPPARRPSRPASRTCCWTTTAWTCRWCWWRTTCRRPTCCSSSRACSPAS
jgi:phosphoenolpyruvate-protein kinase (PTS system EI component)